MLDMSGNRKSRITEIYARQANTVWGVCYSYMQNPDDADDMVQETFVRLMSYSPSFDNEKQERAWMIITASNLCKDTLKSKERRCDSLDDHLELAVEEPIQDSLTPLISKLNENYKTIVYLHYYVGYHVNEIAELLNISKAMVKTTLHRARKKLKEMLEEDNEKEKDHRGL